MRASAFILTMLLAAGCMHPAFIGSSTSERLATCQSAEPCGGGGGDGDAMQSLVLGTATVGAIALVVHRYVIADD